MEIFAIFALVALASLGVSIPVRRSRRLRAAQNLRLLAAPKMASDTVTEWLRTIGFDVRVEPPFRSDAPVGTLLTLRIGESCRGCGKGTCHALYEKSAAGSAEYLGDFCDRIECGHLDQRVEIDPLTGWLGPRVDRHGNMAQALITISDEIAEMLSQRTKLREHLAKAELDYEKSLGSFNRCMGDPYGRASTRHLASSSLRQRMIVHWISREIAGLRSALNDLERQLPPPHRGREAPSSPAHDTERSSP